MNIRPLHDNVLLKRVDSEGEKTHGGLYIPDSAKEKPQEGEVIAVGKGKRNDKTGGVDPLDVQVGDKVLFRKYAGTELKFEGEEVIICREDEVLAIVDRQPKAAKKAS